MLGEFAIVAADFGRRRGHAVSVRHRSQGSGGRQPGSWRLAQPVAAAADGLDEQAHGRVQSAHRPCPPRDPIVVALGAQAQHHMGCWRVCAGSDRGDRTAHPGMFVETIVCHAGNGSVWKERFAARGRSSRSYGTTCPSTCARVRSSLCASFSRPDPMVVVWAQAVKPLPGRCRSRYGAVEAGVASAVSAATIPVANPWMRSAVISPSATS